MTDASTILLGELARPALHDLANGVAGLAGLIELMELDADPATELGAQLASAARAAGRLRSLIRGLQVVAADDPAEIELRRRTDGALEVHRAGELVLTLGER
jgi:signal transduction histidine kinase